MTVAPTAAQQCKACIRLPKATAFVDWLLHHWQSEGLQVRQPQPDGLELALADVGLVSLQVASTKRLDCVLQPVNARMGELMQLSLTEHLAEFADDMGWPDDSWAITWEGEPARSAVQLHIARVIGNQPLTPRMRRIRLALDGTAAFAPGGLHVRLLLPQAGVAPAWPTVLDDGRLQWMAGKNRLTRRTYTISAINIEESWIEIDALLHQAPTGTPGDSPGASWAASAAPGSEVAVLSPASGLVHRATHRVLVADACALPAAARMVQAQPAGHAAYVLLWVADAQERPAFAAVPNTSVTWLYGGRPGATQLEIAQVLQWLGQQNWQSADTALWVAGGLPLAQAVRGWVAGQPELTGVRTMVHTYWR